jgi:hypothetical protein
MGTITRGFANNITTSGVLRPGAFNNSSFDSVTSVPDGSVESGSMVFLNKTTISSGASSANFTLTSTYKEYILLGINLKPTSNSEPDVGVNFSTDGGSTFVQKTNSNFEMLHGEAGANGQIIERAYANNSTAMDYFPFNISTDSDSGISGYLHIIDPTNTTFMKHYYGYWMGMHPTGPRSTVHFQAGYCNTTTALDTVSIIPEYSEHTANTFASGTILLYGIV